MPKKDLQAVINTKPTQAPPSLGGAYVPSASGSLYGGSFSGVRYLADDNNVFVSPESGSQVIRLRGGQGLDVRWTEGSIIEFAADATTMRNASSAQMFMAPGSVVTVVLPKDALFVTVADTIFASGDVALLRKGHINEYIRINGSYTTDADGRGFTYPILRDITSTAGDQTYPAGTPILRLGPTGSVYMEIDGQETSDGHSGPSVVIREVGTGDTVVGQPVVVLGNLSDQYGLGSSTYWGLAAGKYGGGSWFSVDADHGLRVGTGSTVQGHFTPTGDVKLYDGTGTQRVEIGSSGAGWLGGPDRIYWDALGNMTITGTLTTGTLDATRIILGDRFTYTYGSLTYNERVIPSGAGTTKTYGQRVIPSGTGTIDIFAERVT